MACGRYGIRRTRRPSARLPDTLRRPAELPCTAANRTRAGDVWADTAYRSQANEKFLAGRLLRSQIHRKKPKGKPMPRRTARANARKSAVRAAVEHVFARQKGPMGLFIRTIPPKIGLANLLYNMQRRSGSPGGSCQPERQVPPQR